MNRMKRLLFILAFLPLFASAQNYIYFGATRTTDTSRTLGALRVDGKVRIPSYANTDTNRVLSTDAGGNFVWRVKTTSSGGGGGGDSTVFLTIFREDTAKANLRTFIRTKTDSAYLRNDTLYAVVGGTPYYAGKVSVQAPGISEVLGNGNDAGSQEITNLSKINGMDVPLGQTGYFARTVNAQAADAFGRVAITKSDISLGNVDNTSDLNKPISTATQTALNGKANTSHTHAASDITSGTLASGRLAAGTATDGLVVKMVGGTPTWATDATGGGGSGDSIVSFGKNATRDSFVIITSSVRRLAATDSFTVYSAARGINVIGSTIGLDTTRSYTWLAPQSISSSATPQRTVINGSGSFTESVSSAGAVTFDAVGTSAGFTFNDNLNLRGSTLVKPSGTASAVVVPYRFVVESTDLAAAFTTDQPTNSLSGRAFAIGTGSENFTRAIFYSNGAYGVGSGSATRDVFLARSAANTFRIGGDYDGTGTGHLVINGNTSIGTGLTPTARIHIAAGTTTASTAPLKLTLGTDNTTAETGAVEFSNVSGIPRLSFVPSGTTRRRFPLTNDVAPANGQIPIGNGTDYTVANITAGSGISVTNGAGSITIAATGGGGSSTSLDSLRLGGNVNVVGQLVNQSFATGSLPTGWSKGSTLTANYTANGTLITAPATWAYNGAGAYQTPINAAFQYDAKRMPYEDIDMEIDLVVNTVTSSTHMVFTKINNGFFLGNSIVPWTFNLSNGFGSGRVTQSAGLTSNAGDSTARNPIRSGDTITLTWSKSGWGVVAGIINRTTGITTKSYFNNLYNDAGGLYNFVFQNGGANAYTLRAIRVSSKARKGGVCFIGDSQLSGSFATSEASRYANLTMRNNYKYFNVVGLPSVSARYFYLGNIIDEIMADVQPEVVVNALGINDQVDAGGGGVDNFRDAMDSINTRAQRGGATVFIVGNTPRTSTTTDAFYDTTQALAARRNIPFVPSRTFLTDGSGRARASLFPDGLHGNDSMHILIANSLLSMAGERLNRYFVRDTNSILNIAGLPAASDNVTELIARQKDGKAVVVPYFPPSRKYVENQWFTGLPVSVYPFTSPQNVAIDASSFLRSRDHLSVLSPEGLQIGHYVSGAADKRSNISIGNWIHSSGSDGQGFPTNEGKRIISISARGGSVPRMHTGADLSTFINSVQNNQTGANGFNGRNITAIDCGTCNTLNDAARGVYIGDNAGGVVDGTGNITISTSETGTGERSNTIILGRIDQMFNNDAPQSGDIGLHAGATPSLWIGGRAASGNSILNFTATSGTNAAGGIGSIRAPRGTGTGATGSLRLQVWQSTTSGTTFHSNTIDMVTLDAGGITFGAAARLRGYTVATLPTGREGDMAYVTDANATTPGSIVAGGGANKVKVWFNGTNWLID